MSSFPYSWSIRRKPLILDLGGTIEDAVTLVGSLRVLSRTSVTFRGQMDGSVFVENDAVLLMSSSAPARFRGSFQIEARGSVTWRGGGVFDAGMMFNCSSQAFDWSLYVAQFSGIGNIFLNCNISGGSLILNLVGTESRSNVTLDEIFCCNVETFKSTIVLQQSPPVLVARETSIEALNVPVVSLLNVVQKPTIVLESTLVVRASMLVAQELLMTVRYSNSSSPPFLNCLGSVIGGGIVTVTVRFDGGVALEKEITIVQAEAISVKFVLGDATGQALTLVQTPKRVFLTQCPSGMYPQLLCDKKCLRGYFCQGGTIQPCAPLEVAPLEGQGRCGPCPPGSYFKRSSDFCVPCPEGTYSGEWRRNNCSGACDADSFCPLGSTMAVPRAAIDFSQSVLSSNLAYKETPKFIDSTMALLILTIGFGGVVGVGIALFVICCALRRTSKWKHVKAFARADLLFPTRHAGPTPGVVIRRQSVLGAVSTVMTALVFSVLAVFMVLQWYNEPVVSASMLPFGHVISSSTRGRFVANASFIGFSGVCQCTQADVVVTGISSTVASLACTALSYGCQSVWDSGPNATMGVDSSITITLQGHASLLVWQLQVSPHYNASAVNLLGQTILPKNSTSVFMGTTPSTAILTASWVEFWDKTYFAKVPRSNGWLVAHSTSQSGAEADAQSFTSTPNSVGMRIAMSRGATYLTISVDYAQPLVILVGVILGYLGSITSGFAITMAIIETIRMKHAAKMGGNVPTTFQQAAHDFVELSTRAPTSNSSARSSLVPAHPTE